jgi:hypothetical protein
MSDRFPDTIPQTSYDRDRKKHWSSKPPMTALGLYGIFFLLCWVILLMPFIVGPNRNPVIFILLVIAVIFLKIDRKLRSVPTRKIPLGSGPDPGPKAERAVRGNY